MMYSGRIPRWVGKIFPKAWWYRPDPEGIYLTFDDGPTPGITDWLLDVLDLHAAKATFFTVGAQVERHPELLLQVARSGHSIGNHTYHHLKVHKTALANYLRDIEQTDQLLLKLGIQTRLFRPPYGILTPAVYREVSRAQRLVMWEWLTGDFDPEANVKAFEKRLHKQLRPGSILVLHDSEKHGERMFRFLKPILELSREKNWKLNALPQGGDV